MQDAARLILMYAVFPVWVAAGLADWLCHRRTRIEATSGVNENLLHLLMFAEIGAGMLVVAFCEVNAAVLAFVVAVFVVHELTVYWDLHYTTRAGQARNDKPARYIGPFEQMVHSFLELLPLLSLALLAAMSWPQAIAMFGFGDAPADWSLRAKSQPLPVAYLVGAAVLAGLFNALPLLEEFVRCRRFTRRIRSSPAPR